MTWIEVYLFSSLMFNVGLMIGYLALLRKVNGMHK